MASIDGRTPIVPIVYELLSSPSTSSLFKVSDCALAETAAVCRRSSGRFPFEIASGRPSLAPAAN